MEEIEERRKPNVALIIIGSLVAVAVPSLLGHFLTRGDGGPVTAPSGYTAYTASDKSFAWVAPQGWSIQGVGANAVVGGALFKKGSAKIDITADLAGSLMGDIAGAADRQPSSFDGAVPDAAGMPGLPGLAGIDTKPNRKPPIERLHPSPCGPSSSGSPVRRRRD